MNNTLRKILLPTILVILAYGFWISPDFKEISAGIAIFLFGMIALEEGFRAFTGGVLEKILKKSTNRMWKSLAFGFTSATIMQSSSLVSVITISFLSAGLIGLVEGMGIIFGANVGTTTGAWLIAGFGLKVKISEYAMPMLVFGVIFIFQKSKSLNGFGYILAGLGFLFLGIHHMKEGFEAFQHSIALSDYAMTGYAGVLVFTFIGIVATIIMQSSHATLVIIITALSVNQITYDNALALAIGANVGTTITAVLGSLTSNADGKRLALADVLFKVAAGILFIIFIEQAIWLVDRIAGVIGLADSDYTLKLAVFHTIYNVAGVIIMVPLVDRLVALVSSVIASPDLPETSAPKYLNSAAAEFADTAVEAMRRETLRVYNKACGIITMGLSIKKEELFSDLPLDELLARNNKAIPFDVGAAYRKDIKPLFGAILQFGSEIPKEQASSSHLARIQSANERIVSVLKDIKQLQPNIQKFIHWENPHARNEYDIFRKQVAVVLRKIQQVLANGEGEDSDTAILSLDALKLILRQQHLELHERIREMIRNHQIIPETSVSMINDSTYIYHLCGNLIETGAYLLHSSERDESEAEHMIALSEQELDSVLGEPVRSEEPTR